MMTFLVNRILKLGLFLSIVLASAAGCVVWIRASGLTSTEREGSNPGATLSDGRSSKRLEGVAAALVLMAFVTSEALAMIWAFYR
jgi:uncharacterized iron-regulated membrane protein